MSSLNRRIVTRLCKLDGTVGKWSFSRMLDRRLPVVLGWDSPGLDETFMRVIKLARPE